jgi:hypothetical protein
MCHLFKMGKSCSLRKKQQMSPYMCRCDRCFVAFEVQSGEEWVVKWESFMNEWEKEGNEKFYLSRVNNDTVITQDGLFCRLNVRHINSATTIIDQNGAIASWERICCSCAWKRGKKWENWIRNSDGRKMEFLKRGEISFGLWEILLEKNYFLGAFVS